MNSSGTIVIASGNNFPAALSSTMIDGPILLADNSKDLTSEGCNTQKNIEDIVSKFYELADQNGHLKICFLGGENAVSKDSEEIMKAGIFSGMEECNINGTVEFTRISGATRYDTNLAIYDSVADQYTIGNDVVICSGKNFADALSVSGIARTRNMPIFLAGDALTEEAVLRIAALKPSNIYIIGGTSAVNEAVETQAEKLCKSVVRIAGNTRYETSLMIARYFADDWLNIVFAYGGNFPDGLAAGYYAYSKYATIILVSDKNYTEQERFLYDNKEKLEGNNTCVVGGTAVISDATKSHLGTYYQIQVPDEKDPVYATVYTEIYLDGKKSEQIQHCRNICGLKSEHLILLFLYLHHMEILNHMLDITRCFL